MSAHGDWRTLAGPAAEGALGLYASVLVLSSVGASVPLLEYGDEYWH